MIAVDEPAQDDMSLALAAFGIQPSPDLSRDHAMAFVDGVERFISTLPPVEMRLTHRFAPGCYSRELFMPAGTLVTSKIHKTEHFFVVLEGVAKVWTKEAGMVILKAGHIGITKPDTRRILAIIEDSRWATFHVTDKTDVDEIEKDIIEPHHNPLLE